MRDISPVDGRNMDYPITQDDAAVEQAWREVRHDVRNYLNAIKLSCAVLRRRHLADDYTEESLREIEQAADGINALVSGSMHQRVRSNSSENAKTVAAK